MSLESAYKPFDLTGGGYYKLAGVNIPEVVEIRHMTVKEVKYFSQLAQTGDVNTFIDGLLSACCKVTTQGKLDINSMLTGDRVFLFYMLRALTISNKYGFSVNCSECGKLNIADADLYTMEKKHYDTSLGFPLKLKLKHSGKTIEFILPSRGIEKSVEQEVKKFKADNPNGDPPEAVYQLRKLIKSVDGDSDLPVILEFAEEMHIQDWIELDKYITGISPGLDLDVVIPCQFCSHENKEMFSVRPDQFFRFSD
jgi:hypothetical protein